MKTIPYIYIVAFLLSLTSSIPNIIFLQENSDNSPKISDNKLVYETRLTGYASNIRHIPNDKLIKIVHRRIPINKTGLGIKFQGTFKSGEHFPCTPMQYPPHIRDYNVSFAYLRNVYVSRSPSVLTPKNRLALTDFHWLPHIQGTTSGNVIYAFDKAVAPGHSFCDSFGHFHIDFFSILMDMPKDVQQNYYILNVPHGDFVQIALDLIEVPKEHRIPIMQSGEFAFVQELIYPVSPMVHTYHQGEPLHRIQLLYNEKFGLKDIKADKNAIINRRDTRIWYNVNELINALKKAYPSHTWETLEDVHGLRESAKIYATVKFLMTPSGSNLFHCFLMKPDSIILTIEGTVHDWSSIGAIFQCRIHHIIFQSEKLNHVKGFPGFNVDVDKFIKAAGFAVKYLETGKFPEEDLTFL